MEGIFLYKIFTVLGAGFLTSLSPCVYPMIPISLGYFGSQAESGKKINVILFFTGQVLTFTFLGILAVSLGEIFGFSSQNPFVQGSMGLILIAFGIASLFNFVPGFLQTANQIEFKKLSGTVFFPIALGAGAALLASPCTTPVLGAVLVTISTSTQLLSGSIYMFFYALGSTFIFLVVGLGMMSVKNLPKSGGWMKKIHKISSVLIFFAGLFFLYQAFEGL